MTAAFELVTISIEAGDLLPIEVEISASANEAARSFSAKIAPREATADAIAAFAAEVAAIGATLARGPEFRITAGKDLVIAGWIDRYLPVLSSTGPTYTIEGRSKSALLVDSSAIHSVGEWRRATPAKILKDLAERYGVEVTDRTVGSLARSLYRITQGDSVVRHAHRLARVDGASLTGTADGGVTLYHGVLGRHSGGLIEGFNLCEGASAVHDWSKRAKKQTVKGQRADGWSADDLAIAETATDGTVRRPVEVVIVSSEEVDPRAAARRALWRRDQTAGEGLKVMAPATIGWRDDGGRIWEPAHTLAIVSPTLGVDQDMAIESVKLMQSDGRGTIAHLELVDPRALGTKKKKGKGRARKGRSNRSSKQWDMPE